MKPSLEVRLSLLLPLLMRDDMKRNPSVAPAGPAQKFPTARLQREGRDHLHIQSSEFWAYFLGYINSSLIQVDMGSQEMQEFSCEPSLSLTTELLTRIG